MAENTDQVPGGKFNIKNIILGIITVATAWNTLVTTQTRNELSIAKDQLDTAKQKLEIQAAIISNQAATIESEIKKKEFDNDLKFKIYEEVKDAVIKNDEKIQDVVVVIMNEMLADDSAYRAKLSNILLNSRYTAVEIKSNILETQKQEYTFAKVQEETIRTLTTHSDNANYTIDVFYLGDLVKEASSRADKVVELLKKQYPNYIIRKRLLPKTVNARSGYSISSNQVRFEENERPLAEAVIKLIVDKKIFPLEQPVPHPVRNITKNYISVFVRNM